MEPPKSNNLREETVEREKTSTEINTTVVFIMVAGLALIALFLWLLIGQQEAARAVVLSPEILDASVLPSVPGP